MNYKNGKPHGLITYWYKNRRTSEICHDNGKKVALSNCSGSNYAGADDSNSYDTSNSGGGGFIII
ncbi:hypothetical protein SPONL_1022 [uncultured Candidatus Thioglobus sp.]|nr:hypothetical protein SPONL_1022 [uncultured Candidatus Thioglobus sp.]